MRLVQVAKILGMTGQELRHELTAVDFGVKPTDREIPDNLAMGVIRFVARKKGLNIDLNTVMNMADDADEETASAPAATDDAPAAPVAAPAAAPKTEGLNVLRKLTLEDVPKEAIARERAVLKTQKPPSKQELEQKRFEAKTMSRLARPDVSKTNQQQIKKKEGPVSLPSQVSVKEFAEKAGVQVPKVVAALMKNGIMATINQQIDFDTAAIVAMELGVTVEREAASVSVEALLKKDLSELIKEEDQSKLSERPPIVTVMGHVDHGKTAILDAIRSTNVVAGEAGGITQHIGAYQIEKNGKRITFIDTPGHEAFTAMRARGAQVTDLVILVVSAEEGVKPTTIEAIDHVKDAEVPMIVAINKIDRPNADIERVKGELAGHGLQAEDWGGNVPMVPCSALTKQGIDDLIVHILLRAEAENLKANPDRPAIATVIESRLDRFLGPVATVIVNTGTLKVGDLIGCGHSSGRVKALMDALGKRQDKALPSEPVAISGFDKVPQSGDIVQVFATDRELTAYLEAYAIDKDEKQKRGFGSLVSRLTEGKLSQLKIVLKADTQGSLESLQEAMRKLATVDVQPKVIHAAIGDVSESDVMMASASDGIVLAFSVDLPSAVIKTAEREGVTIKSYDIIYKLLEDLELLLKGLVEPVEEEKVTGHLEVRGVFFTKGDEQIIGGKVTDGLLKRYQFRVQRDGQIVGTGRITSLKNVERDIKEAKEGMECGMKVVSTASIQEGDILEVFNKEFSRVGEGV